MWSKTKMKKAWVALGASARNRQQILVVALLRLHQRLLLTIGPAGAVVTATLHRSGGCRGIAEEPSRRWAHCARRKCDCAAPLRKPARAKTEPTSRAANEAGIWISSRKTWRPTGAARSRAYCRKARTH